MTITEFLDSIDDFNTYCAALTALSEWFELTNQGDHFIDGEQEFLEYIEENVRAFGGAVLGDDLPRALNPRKFDPKTGRHRQQFGQVSFPYAFDVNSVLVHSLDQGCFLVLPRNHEAEARDATWAIVAKYPSCEAIEPCGEGCTVEVDEDECDEALGTIGVQHYAKIAWLERVVRVVTENGFVVEESQFSRIRHDTVGLVRQTDGTWQEYYPSEPVCYREDFQAGRMVPC